MASEYEPGSRPRQAQFGGTWKPPLSLVGIRPLTEVLLLIAILGGLIADLDLGSAAAITVVALCVAVWLVVSLRRWRREPR